MKVIDYVEYLLNERSKGGEVRIGGEILNEYLNSVSTATPEEAKKVVEYIIKDLLGTGGIGASGYNAEGKITYIPNIGFDVPKEGDKIVCVYIGGRSGSIDIPHYIDRETYENFMTAINETQIFDVFTKTYESGTVSVRFEIPQEKLYSYSVDEPKKL